jgi:hypothetical protein
MQNERSYIVFTGFTPGSLAGVFVNPRRAALILQQRFGILTLLQMMV